MLASRLFLAVILLAATPGRAADDDPMRPLSINGYQLIDAEYWTFVADTPFQYPSDVQWGFYADGTSPAARDCAMQAFTQLGGLFSADVQPLHDVVALGGTPRFYLWINDYTTASRTRERRPAQLWHLADGGGGGGDYTGGSWQWEATLTQDGVCTLPGNAQIADALVTARQALGGH